MVTGDVDLPRQSGDEKKSLEQSIVFVGRNLGPAFRVCSEHMSGKVRSGQVRSGQVGWGKSWHQSSAPAPKSFQDNLKRLQAATD